MQRAMFPVGLAGLLSLALAGPVLAAAPANDTYPGATIIGSLPFSATVDTTEATTDADDTEANTTCGAPATDASVWYSFTPSSDGGYVVDVTGSDYPAGVIVATGAPGSFETVTCGAGVVPFLGLDGETYSILVFDYAGTGNGGTLEILVDVAPPPPTADATVNAQGRFSAQSGDAWVRGTLTCDGGSGWLEVHLDQKVGRFMINGTGAIKEVVCDGTTQAWDVGIRAANGKFAGGKAKVTVFLLVCGPFECAEAFVERSIMLRR
jgi:hypothetical protein